MKKIALMMAVGMMVAVAAAVELATPEYAIRFADAEGGFAVTGIVNRLAGDVSFIRPQPGCSGFWRLKFMRTAGDGARATATLTNLDAARSRVARQMESGVEFRWSGMSLPGAEGAVEVVARVTRNGEEPAMSDWEIEVRNTSGVWGLYSTDYPILAAPLRWNEGKVLSPSGNLGARYSGVAWEGVRPYFHSMPMVAAFDFEGAGLYVAARDGEARIKQTVFEKQNTVMFRTVVENAGTTNAAEGPRFKTGIAVYKGDWWQAAKLHRRWALKQYWAKGAARRLDEAAPHWLNIHAGPKGTTAVLAKAKAELPEFATGVHWHLWQNAGHDINYPEYFPAQPGTAEAIAEMKAMGQVPMLYINGRRWSSNLQGFRFAMPFAVKEADGRVHETLFPPAPALASMCPSRPEWHGVVSNLVDRMVTELGAPAVFLDEIGNEPCVPCFDAGHGHPLGGGRWWADGCRATIEPSARICHEHGAFVTTEGSTEALMDLVDGFLIVSGRSPDEVPWYTAVYSGYATYFGSPAHIDDTEESFWMLQAREVLRGIVPGWYYIGVLENKRKAEMMRRLLGFRREQLRYFTEGELVDEFRAEGALGEVKGNWKGRSTAPKQQAAKGAEVRMPAVIGTVWQAEKRVMFLANLSGERQRVRSRNDGFKGRDIEMEPWGLVVVDAQK